MPFMSLFKKVDEKPVTLDKIYASMPRKPEKTIDSNPAESKAEPMEPQQLHDPQLREPFTPSDSCAPRPVWLYGLDELYNIVQYSRHDYRGISMMNFYADQLRNIKPHITEIYAIDGSAVLSDYFKKTFRNPSLDSRVCFRDYLKSCGILVWNSDRHTSKGEN